MITQRYSDGLADAKMTSQPDSKRHLSFGSNPVTRSISFGTRLMVGKKSIFRVTHINDFEYNSAYSGADGLIKALVLYTSAIAKDDIENGIAWNEEEIQEEVEVGLIGDDKVSLGTTETYTVKTEERVRFEILLDSDKFKYAEMLGETFSSCKIKITTDSRFAGKKIILNCYKVSNGTMYDSKEIKITSF